MATKRTQERLLPCLLDRLTDDDPRVTRESRNDRVVSMEEYRASVLRDLFWLFNTPCNAQNAEIWQHPEAASSVANYGFPNLCGRTVGSMDVPDLERRVMETIRSFEPRILPHTLQVRVNPDHWHPGVIELEIEGDLWAYPVPERLWIRTKLDIETGCFTIGDRVYE